MWYVDRLQVSYNRTYYCSTLESNLTPCNYHHLFKLQHVIVHHVYLSGNPSLVEEAGFGAGEKGYASLQCAMSEYEGDPLINQYAAAGMAKVWEAAGLPSMQ